MIAKISTLGTRARWFFMLCIISSLLCSTGANAGYRSGTTDQVTAAFSKFVEFYSNKDVKGIMTMFADDSDIIAIGLCNHRAAVGPQAIENLFEKDLLSMKGTIKLPFDIISVDHLGLTAWLAANVYPYAVLNNGTIVKGTQGRLTLVLRKTKGRWHILQLHFSLPIDTGTDVRGDRLAVGSAP